MKHTLLGAVVAVLVSAGAAQAQSPECNPYTDQACADRLAQEAATTNRWFVGDLSTDAGARRFGWLIVTNLTPVPQTAFVRFVFDGMSGRRPILRAYALGPQERLSITLHGDPELVGYYDALVEFPYDGIAGATFQPNLPPDSEGKTYRDGRYVPRRTTPLTFPQ